VPNLPDWLVSLALFLATGHTEYSTGTSNLPAMIESGVGPIVSLGSLLVGTAWPKGIWAPWPKVTQAALGAVAAALIVGGSFALAPGQHQALYGLICVGGGLGWLIAMVAYHHHITKWVVTYTSGNKRQHTLTADLSAFGAEQTKSHTLPYILESTGGRKDKLFNQDKLANNERTALGLFLAASICGSVAIGGAAVLLLQVPIAST
jgi:hypothetical protein